MLDVVFFTSSKVKLAHANYLSRNYNVRFVGFKEKTYHASYYEPRIYDRDSLLRQSYYGALEQARKAKLNLNNPFVLEDTSVNIFSLSKNNGYETPGLDIKYWMKDTSFKNLDEQLLKLGNKRLVEVRSDVVLHIPLSLRGKYDADYLIFTSKSYGSIVDKEDQFDTQALYPWLDNKTFNKWFVPISEKKCISQLDIEVADKYDFRRNAFKKVFDFLFNEGFLSEEEYYQSVLELKEGEVGSNLPENLIVVGLPCAGKTSVAQFLNNKYGYLHVEASDFMHATFRELHSLDGSVQIGDFAEQILMKEPIKVAEQVKDFIDSVNLSSAVITGFRKKEEVDYIRTYMAYKKFNVIYVDSSEEIRKSRFEYRARVQSEKFSERDARENNMGMTALKEMSSIITNEKTLDEFFNEFSERYIGYDKGMEGFIYKNSDLFCKILYSLKTVWTNEVDSRFYTTTEISELINRVFSEADKKKHKDNVSRFFNQKISPLFDVELIDGKMKYRLSNTGYSISSFIEYESIS